MLVRERRKELGLTQAQLGERLDPPVTFAAISGWERNGDIPEARVAELAAALEMELDELMGDGRYVSDTDTDRQQFMNAVGDSGLSLRAMAVLYRLGYDPELTRMGDDGLEFSGSLSRIAGRMRHLSHDDVEAVWPDILDSGFVEPVTDARWHVVLRIP